MKITAKVVLFNKPYGVHSQFKKENDAMQTLSDFLDDQSLRVAGRLDKDSEGLLVLTNHGGLNHAITTPPTAINAKYANAKHTKTYLVQVENIPSPDQIRQLQQGVLLKDGKTLPAEVMLLDEQEFPIGLWQRNPPIRQRATIPTSWLMMSICEGKNRQVRRMVAQVGLPCLRLIRYQVGPWKLGGLAVGESCVLQLGADELKQLGVIDAETQTAALENLKARPSLSALKQNITDFKLRANRSTTAIKPCTPKRNRPPKFAGKV